MTQTVKYDKTSAASIFAYSTHLLGHCLRDVAPDAQVRTGKGALGQLVEELYFEYEVNSDDRPDFHEAGLELKCTPLKLSTKEEYLIKERLVCGMINYCTECGVPFEESHFYRKCLFMLIMFYLHQKGASQLDLQFLFALLWRIPEKDLIIIRNDYNIIMGKIESGLAHTLSEGDTMYLGACRKGQKGDSLTEQPRSEIGAHRRAWSLKTSYMRTLLDYVKTSGKVAVTNTEITIPVEDEIVSLKQLKKNSFDDILLKRILPFKGKNCNQVFKKFGMPLTRSKSKYGIAANAIVSEATKSNVNLSEEFMKAGLVMKTIRVELDGSINESMSFENIDYQEIYDNENWTDSRLYEIFSNRFLFVVFRATGEQMRIPASKESKRKYELEDEYVLDDAFFWAMPQGDLEVAQEYWEDIRKQVLDDNICNGAFWSQGLHRKFHVRPKARKSYERHISPVTGLPTAQKFCYWFNNEYVKNIIDLHNGKEI